MSQDPGVMLVYSLWDRKLQEFGALALSRNDESVIRALGDGLRGSRSQAEMHPEDFDLMQVGEFHPDSGFLAGRSGPPRLVLSVAAVLNPWKGGEDASG